MWLSKSKFPPGLVLLLFLNCFVFSFSQQIVHPTTSTTSTTKPSVPVSAAVSTQSDEDGSFVAKPVVLSHKSENKSSITESEEDEDDAGSCEPKLGTFVRNYNVSQLLPDDFYRLEERVVNSDIYADGVTHINQTFEIINRLLAYGNKLRNNADLTDTVRYLSSVLTDRLYQARLSPGCTGALLRIGGALQNREIWALRFFDSFGHILPSGVLRGHMSSLGEFDECIRTKSPPNDQGEHIYGKHCQLQFRSIFPPLEGYNPVFEDIVKAHPFYDMVVNLTRKAQMDNYLSFNLVQVTGEAMKALSNSIYFYGVCFPSTCSPTDIERLFNALFYPITMMPTRVQEHMCTAHKEVQKVVLDTQQWVAVISLISLAVLVLLCSLYHYFLISQHRTKQAQLDRILAKENGNNNNNNTDKSSTEAMKMNGQLSTQLSPPKYSIGDQFILAFSAIKNTEKLIYQQNRYAVVDTIRFVLTVFVFALQFVHFGSMLTLQMMRNLLDTVPGELIHSNAYWYARAPGFLIDGFVFTLGFMLIISQFSRLKRANGNFSFLIYLWKRWIRLSIAMLGTFFVIFLFPLTGDGPMWFAAHQWLMPPCKSAKSILSSFLYYSNWNGVFAEVAVDNTLPLCNPPTWFLSMSTQLYVIAPLIFLPMYHYPRAGVTLAILCLLLSPLATSAPYWYYGYHTYYEATKFKNIESLMRSFQFYHTNTIQYFTTLLIGMLTGYLVKCKPNMAIPGGRCTERVLWALALSTPIAVYAWNCTFWDYNIVVPTWSALGWQIMSKIGQGFWLGYLCFMCCTGRAGIINDIVSIRAIQPIAKLSYSIYLLRMPTILYRFMSKRHTYELYYWQMWQNIFVDYLITACLAYMLYLLFEAPSGNIMAIFEGEELYRYLRGGAEDDKKRIEDTASTFGSSNNENQEVGESYGNEDITIQVIQATPVVEHHLRIDTDRDEKISVSSSRI